MGLVDSIKKFFGGLGVSSFISEYSVMSKWSRQEFVHQFKNYVYPCVSVRAEETAKAKFVLYKVKPDGTKDKILTHPILSLLQNPNPDITGFQMVEIHQKLIDLEGECPWYMPYGQISKKPKEIYPLKGSMIDVAVNKETNLISGYVFNAASGVRIPLAKEEIIFHRIISPKNPQRGMGVIEAGMDYIQTEQATANWSKNFIGNNAAPNGIVNFKGKISDDDFQKIQREWRYKYGGTKNAGKTAFIRNSEIDFVKIGAGYSDIALKELKDITKEDVMFMFRVSKPMLGIVDDVNLNNGKNAKRIFLENVVQPNIERLVDQLNHDLVPRFGEGLELGFEPIVPEDRVEKSQYLSNANYMSLNEKRERDGLDRIETPEADSVMIPINVVPIGENVNQNNSNDNSNVNKSIKQTHKLKDYQTKDGKEAFRISLYKIARAWEKKFTLEWNKVLDRQAKYIVGRIQGKSLISTKAFEDWLPKEDESVQELIKAVEPLMLELMVEQGQQAIDLLQMELKFELSENVKRYVSKRVNKFIPENVVARQNALVESLTEGLKNGESLSKLTRRVNDIYQQEKDYKTERVARTETSFASNKSAVEAYYQSGVVSEKEWYANPGACGWCEQWNGKKIGLAENFASIGEPLSDGEGHQRTVDFEDIGEPPQHPNCECTILPV